MQKADNKTMGNHFEQELAEILANHGFWCHVMQQNKAGQPADIIAVKGKFHTLIDCKVCEDGTFPFRRVEENQRMAMRLFSRKANELCYFAFKLPSGQIRMISMSRIQTLEGRKYKQLNAENMINETWNIEDWLDSSNTWAED